MKKKVVNVVGVHQRLEGYPNVLFLLDELERTGSLEYKEYNVPMWTGSLSSKKNIHMKVNSLFKAVYSHLNVLYYLFKTPNLERVYLPYPAIFIASALFLFPKKRKPTLVVIDAFISGYDTAIIDRKLYLQSGLIARFLKKLEKTAFEQADLVITDTNQNSLYYSQLFNIPTQKFKNIPLATDEKNFNLEVSSRHKKTKTFNVFFVGTLIPLHGIETILKSAELLINKRDITFTIIGNGQMSSIIESALDKGLANIEWIKDWQSSKALANHLSRANIGLGVFGKGDKTQRVCPFKLYLYAACGLPIITGSTKWTNQAIEGLGYTPFLTVDVNSPEMLADKILMCYNSQDVCEELSSGSRFFYKNELSNSKIVDEFESIF